MPSKRGRRFGADAGRAHGPIAISLVAIWSALAVAPVPAAPTQGAPSEAPVAADAMRPAHIPFEVDRNRTIVRFEVGGSRPLRLILDTGMPMDGVYLFHKEARNEVALEDPIEVLIPGAGGGEPSKGIMAESVPVSAGGVVFGHQRAIISLSEHTQGFPTDGVIGWSLFGHYAVELDYDTMVMTLHPPGSFVPDSTWYALPIALKENIPWLSASVDAVGEGAVPVDCYIDFASGDAVELLVREGAKFPIPENMSRAYLGTGLSGDVYGGTGQITSFTIGPHTVFDVPAVFPMAATRSKQEGADAVIGNRLLRRFDLVFDYDGGTLWLRPNDAFGLPF
jgi:hypothetical protein